MPGGRPPTVFTSAVREQIPLWVEAGLGPTEIADKVGTTLGSLYRCCSYYQISLDKKTNRIHPRSIGNSLIDLDKIAGGKLAVKAKSLHVSPERLARSLLEAIAHDDLFDAVLDPKRLTKP